MKTSSKSTKTGNEGSEGGKPIVLAARVTKEFAADFDRKRGGLSRSEASRLALLTWPGVV